MVDRMDKLRKARNLNELMLVVKEIQKENEKSSATVKNLKSVLSSDELKISHTDKVSKVAITKFSAPNLTKIKKHNDLVKKLYDNANELSTAEALVKNSFSGTKGSKEAIAAIKALLKNVEQDIAQAFDALAEIASNHQPKEVEKHVNGIANFLINGLDKASFTKVSQEVYVTIEDGEIQFCNYLNVEGLKDSQGFVSEDYFVVSTAVVDKSSVLKFYLTSIHEFKPPGKYNKGREVSSIKNATQELQKLLAHDSVHGLLEQKPLDVDVEKTEALKKLNGVESAKVEDDILTVKVSSSVRDVNTVVVNVMNLLKTVVGKNSRIRHKVSVKNKKTVITFMLTSDVVDRTRGLNVSKLDNLKEMLDLSDDDVKAVKQALKNK
jgi:hypothetical protein